MADPMIQDRARARKVSALVETLSAAGATAAGLEYFTDAAWQLAADCAGVRAPSQRTCELVVSALELREQPDVDPFAGLDEVAA